MKLYRAKVFFVVLLFTALACAQSVIKPADNLVTEGIPPVPASIAEQAGRYTEVRSATVADWHPSKREMLIVTRFADTNQVHMVKMPGGARTQLTFFPDRVLGARFGPPWAITSFFSKTSAAANGSSSIATISPPATSPCSPTANRATWVHSFPTPAIAWCTPPPAATTRTPTFGS